MLARCVALQTFEPSHVGPKTQCNVRLLGKPHAQIGVGSGHFVTRFGEILGRFHYFDLKVFACLSAPDLS
jgi:hypothetical protein